MAYDPIKAHEYYEKYVKKGLRKGRKKGSSDTKKSSSKKKGSSKKKASTKKTSLIGVSTSGLNNAGRIEAAFVKEKITKQMNDALAKETTDEGKEKVRREYSQKAQEELDKLKKDPKYAKEKKASSKSGKSSNKGSSGGSSSKGSSKDTSKGTSKSTTKTKDTTGTKKSSNSKVKVINTVQSTSSSGKGNVKAGFTIDNSLNEERQKLVDQANKVIESISSQLSGLSPSEKVQAKKKITATLNTIRKKINSVKG